MFIYKKGKPFFSLGLKLLKRPFSILLAEEATIVDCKDEIVFFKNFQPDTLKYQSLLRTKENNAQVLLLSLNETISCGPLIKKLHGKGENNSVLLNQQLEFVPTEKNQAFLTYSEDIVGKIVDFQGNCLESQENNEKTEGKNSKTFQIQDIFKAETKIPRRTGTDGQLWTGF